ncbi:MAG: acyl-CoA dehydrogenase family protein, partial [Vicinamibacteria bacterium]|nr:acyl-CoA dehydrogenase family protein [Vicinamibacteria bacterium]
MTTETLQPVAAKGGDFLIEDRTPGEVFTPEDYTDEQNMLAQTARDFMQKAVLPKTPQILKLDYEVIRQSMREAGEIGLLGIEVPEEYGGLALG